MTERTIQVRPEGLVLFREWAVALQQAEVQGEEVPGFDDVDGIVAWLEAHELIVEPVTPSRARVLIALVQAGASTPSRRAS